MNSYSPLVLNEIISKVKSEAIKVDMNSDYLRTAVQINHKTKLRSFIPSYSGIAISNDLISNQQWIIINGTKVLEHTSLVCESKRHHSKKKFIYFALSKIGCQSSEMYLMNYCIQIKYNPTKCRSIIALSKSHSDDLPDLEMSVLIKLGFQLIGISNRLPQTVVYEKIGKFKNFYMGFHLTTGWSINTINNSDLVKHWMCIRIPRNIINLSALNAAPCLDKQQLVRNKFCDGITHCHGDETNCESMCRDINGEIICECSNKKYQCRNKHECIAWSKVCDEKADCSNQSDEQLCSDELSSNRAVALSKKTSSKYDCLENWSSCGNVSLYCYSNNKMCLYERNLVGEQMHCPNSYHLKACSAFVCLSNYKCSNSFCIP